MPPAHRQYGLSWQIAPRRLLELMTDPDHARAKRVMEAMMQMKRIDIAAIERAAAAMRILASQDHGSATEPGAMAALATTAALIRLADA